MKSSLLFIAGAAIVALHLTATAVAAGQTKCPDGTKLDADTKKCVAAPRGSTSG